MCMWNEAFESPIEHLITLFMGGKTFAELNWGQRTFSEIRRHISHQCQNKSRLTPKKDKKREQNQQKDWCVQKGKKCIWLSATQPSRSLTGLIFANQRSLYSIAMYLYWLGKKCKFYPRVFFSQEMYERSLYSSLIVFVFSVG